MDVSIHLGPRIQLIVEGMNRRYLTGLVVLCVLGANAAFGQHKIAYVDSDFIYKNYPEFATAQQNLDRMAAGWEDVLAERQEALDEMFKEYQARELLYTISERQRKQQEIVALEEEIERLRLQYFGPEGELYRQQEQVLRPIQEKVLEAIESVATSEDYDYVFDRSGGVFVFLFANDQLDISEYVLEELGIDTQRLIRS